ncbi:MAG: GNAT family N-acetyltransferase [Candidatus Spyradosoma sp.]
MRFDLLPLLPEDLPVFKNDMREAFQKGAVAEFGKIDVEVLPEKDIDRSLGAKGAHAYKALADGVLAGGAVVVADERSRRNHLDFLYVKHGIQSRGIGLRIWRALEALWPETEVWETVTPYFERRNIHFYVNRCGFHAVEFFNPRHKSPHDTEGIVGGDYFFRFEKKMPPRREA